MKQQLIVGALSLCMFGMTGAYAKQNIELYYTGPAVPNTAAAPDIPAFNSFCNGTCFPTTQFKLTETATGKTVGQAHVWGNGLAVSGDTLCFQEFIEYDMTSGGGNIIGSIYTLGYAGKTCGTYMDRSLVIPKSTNDPNTYVLAGGGEGLIVGGSGKYSNISGKYNDRVFVEIDRPNFGIKFYDGLFFNLMLDSNDDSQ